MRSRPTCTAGEARQKVAGDDSPALVRLIDLVLGGLRSDGRRRTGS